MNKTVRFAYVDLGSIYLAQKNYREAEPALLQAIKLAPSEPDAHYQLGRLYQALGKKVEAERELKTVRELHQKADEKTAGRMTPPSADEKSTEQK